MFYLLILNSKNCLNSLNSLINKMTINISLILLIVALNFNISLAKTITKISKTSAPKIMTQTIIVTISSTQQPTGTAITLYHSTLTSKSPKTTTNSTELDVTVTIPTTITTTQRTSTGSLTSSIQIVEIVFGVFEVVIISAIIYYYFIKRRKMINIKHLKLMLF